MENQEIQFPLLYTKPSIDKYRFLSFKCWYSRNQFVDQPYIACTISSVDLSGNHATIVECSGSIYRPNVPIRQVLLTDLSAIRSQRVKMPSNDICGDVVAHDIDLLF